MMPLAQLSLVVIASIVLIFTPGPDIIYVWICFSMVGLGSGWIGAWLRQNEKAEAGIGRAAGSILIALGLKLAIPDFR